jgi:hypothetical protein
MDAYEVVRLLVNKTIVLVESKKEFMLWKSQSTKVYARLKVLANDTN